MEVIFVIELRHTTARGESEDFDLLATVKAGM